MWYVWCMSQGKQNGGGGLLHGGKKMRAASIQGSSRVPRGNSFVAGYLAEVEKKSGRGKK